MPIVTTHRTTAEEFLQLDEDPEGIRRELVNGEITLSPSPIPEHSFVVLKLAHLLISHIDAHDLGELHHDVDTILSRFTVRRPDILFFFKERTHLIGEKHMEGLPDLAVEVISPGSKATDRVHKFAEYKAAGVVHYWVIDPKLRTIDGWQLVNGEYEPSGHGQGNAIVQLPPFADLQIPLERLWRNK